jgi:pimeloyl-ACP methyl ester carboxylesterase
MRQILVAAVNESYEEQLRRIKCPTVLICGEFDTAATPEMTRKAAKLLSDGRVSIVEGTGHLLDEALVSEVRRWMQGVPE